MARPVDKSTIREKYLKIRQGLTKGQVLQKSAAVFERLKRVDQVREATVISCYLAINKQSLRSSSFDKPLGHELGAEWLMTAGLNEVETREIIAWLVEQGKEVCLPKYDVGRKTYFLATFGGWKKLEKGPYGIWQPKETKDESRSLDDKNTSSSWNEVIGSNIRKQILSLALQNDNKRGFDPSQIGVAIIPGLAFDRRGVRLGYGKGVFDRLLCDSPAFKIGLAYDFQIVDELPRTKHDLVMDLVVTEKRLIRPTIDGSQLTV